MSNKELKTIKDREERMDMSPGAVVAFQGKSKNKYFNHEFGRCFNVRPSLPHHYEKVTFDLGAEAPPPSISLRSGQSLVKNQGQTEACSCYAAASVAEYRLLRKNDGTVLSSHFPFYNTEYIEGKAGQDVGVTSNHDVVKAGQSWGFATEATCPSNEPTITQRPSNEAYADGAKRIMLKPQFLNTAQSSLIAALATGNPFEVGIPVYRQFMFAPGGRVAMPGMFDFQLGGHDIVITGYDLNQGYWEFKNSYGEEYGDGGYGYLPLAYQRYFFDPITFDL